MSVHAKWMHSISCDHPGGCSAELETYDGGAWLYDSAREAREAAYDADWATDVDGQDFCERHRPEDREPTGWRAIDVQLAIFDPPLTDAEADAYWEAIRPTERESER